MMEAVDKATQFKKELATLCRKFEYMLCSNDRFDEVEILEFTGEMTSHGGMPIIRRVSHIDNRFPEGK